MVCEKRVWQKHSPRETERESQQIQAMQTWSRDASQPLLDATLLAYNAPYSSYIRLQIT